MPSIYTITFSPCIDKTASVPSLIPEKKLRCSQPKLEPGGGGINVARAIHKLGGSAVAVYPAGGYTGQYFNALLAKERLPCQVIPSSGETRENIIILEESSNNQYRFGMPGQALSGAEWSACLQAITDAKELDYVVASGSLPPGVPADVFGQLAKLVRSKGGKLIVDTSGDGLRHAVQEGVFLIKPNLGELSSLAGKEELSIHEAGLIAKDMINKGGCEVMIISMGQSGAMLVTGEASSILTAPQVVRKSTVGAGDSMVAGIVYYLSTGHNLDESARYGVACGTAATMNPGTELCRKEDADKLFNQVHAIPVR